MSDKKPDVPSDFPSDLKELIHKGWSKEPKERPVIEEFKSALTKMLSRAERDHSQTLPEDNSSNEKEEQHVSCEEVDSEKTEEELSTITERGDLT